MRQTGSYMAWKRLMEGRGYTVLVVYEQEIADFVDSGTGPEVLSALLEPYEIHKVAEPMVSAPIEAQGDAMMMGNERDAEDSGWTHGGM